MKTNLLKTKKMKLYLFNPNTWGMRFFVMAKNKVDAYDNLLTFIKTKINDPEESCYKQQNKELLKLWKKVNPLDENTFPQKYSLEEYESGVIIESELA